MAVEAWWMICGLSNAGRMRIRPISPVYSSLNNRSRFTPICLNSTAGGSTLEEALGAPEGASAAAEALRSLIDGVIFYPEAGRGKYRLELRGDLAAFTYLSDGDTQKSPRHFWHGLGLF